MVLVARLTVIFLTLHLVGGEITRISRRNVLLSRRRRYLNFPMGSNFVVTISMVKSFLQVQPRGWNVLLETDVPFALPSDTRQLKAKATKTKRHVIDRRDFLVQIEDIFTGIGLDGEMCVRRIICTIVQQDYKKGKSLVRDLIYAAFIYPGDGADMGWDKCDVSLVECSVPFLEHFVGNIFLQ